MASRFWVGGTGTWDAATTTHWAASSNGSGGQSVPGSSDTVTFDGASGGGTVTVNTTVTVLDITCGAFTGTLDFSANNNNVTLSSTTGFNGSGSATRTFNLGNGTWTLSATSGNIWNLNTTTGLTFNANSSEIIFSGTGTAVVQFLGGGKTYNKITINANSNRGGVAFQGSNTIATLAVAAPNTVSFLNGTTTTITNAFTFTGTASNPIGVISASPTAAATISVASGSPTIDYGAVRGMTFSGGATFTATNSYNLGLNTGITITAPSGAGMLYVPNLEGT